jgi:hypothetical protein
MSDNDYDRYRIARLQAETLQQIYAELKRLNDREESQVQINIVETTVAEQQQQQRPLFRRG